MAARTRRRAKVAVAVAVLAAAAACGGADSRAGPTHTRTGPAPLSVEYAPGLTESVYLPTGTSAPLVLMVPGGSWSTADPTGLADLAGYLADAGSVAVPVRIRAGQDGVRYPVPVDDILCALASAVTTARAHGVRAGPLVVLGHSSGAHLAALAVLAVSDYSPDCRAPLVRPDALVGVAGPYDVSQVPDLAHPLFGTTPDDDAATWASANPVQRAGLRPEVPVLLVHGEQDDVVPTSMTTQFNQALQQAGHPTTLEIVPDADHGSVFSSAVAGPIITRWLASLPRAADDQ